MTTKEVFAKYTTPETFARIRDYESVSEMWDNCIPQYRDAIAIEDDGKKYTYMQLEEDAAAARKFIVSKSLKNEIYELNFEEKERLDLIDTDITQLTNKK